MRLITCFAALVLCLFGAKAQIVITPDLWDFGVISDAKPVSKEFAIENHLSHPVKIVGVETSCSCNAIFSLPPELSPGEKQKFTLTMQPASKMGRYRWEIKIHTDGKGNDTIILPICALVQRDTLISESFIRLKPFFMGDSIEKKLWMACRAKPDFQILSATCTTPGFTVRITPSAVEGFYHVEKGFLVLVTANHDITPGTKNGEVIVSTDIPGNETIRIPFCGYVNGYIKTSPTYLAFGLLSPGIAYRKTLRISHNRINTPFHVIEAISDLPSIEAKVNTLIKDHFYEITIDWVVPKDAPAGEQRGTLSIRTDFPQQPKVQVPLQGIVFCKKGKEE